MIIDELKRISETTSENSLINFNFSKDVDIEIYPYSINEYKNSLIFIGKEKSEKNLYILSNKQEFEEFDISEVKNIEAGISLIKCPQNHHNADQVQKIFSFAKPKLIGLQNSFGFGDRLGLANPAHIRALGDSAFKPIIAQQSIRELTRTQRKPEDVMDAAIWAVLQEGYKKGFGADADHLKTADDIDLMIKSGYTMFTFDPGEHVVNDADNMSIADLREALGELNWEALDDAYESLMARYDNSVFDLGENFILKPGTDEILRASVKYLNAVIHIKGLFGHLKKFYHDYPYEVEISVDETESVTSPFEHFFMASELKRLGIDFISLAPRFIGDFEKGIDYKGDIEVFKNEYLKHVKISEHFGSYKISLHSGSDKFDVYRAIGQINRGFTHVKTAGTSYLEALKVVASVDSDKFRKILDFSRAEFEKEKESYHVSADLKNVKSSAEYSDSELVELFNQDDARQVLHVTFGKVLTTKDANGDYLFRDLIYKILKENEAIHYNFLINHFKNHLNPFK